MAAKSGPNRNRLRLNMTLTSETVLQKNRVARSIFSETNTPIAWIIATTTPLLFAPAQCRAVFVTGAPRAFGRSPRNGASCSTTRGAPSRRARRREQARRNSQRRL